MTPRRADLTFMELLSGTASVSYAIVGAERLTPYMGSKKLLAPRLVELMQVYKGRVGRFVWVDASEWGRTLDVVHRRPHDVAVTLWGWGHKRRDAELAGEDVRYWTDDAALFDRLRNKPPHLNEAVRAASHLYLQVRSFNGKPVYPNPDGTGWCTHGFDPEYRDTKDPTSRSNRGWATPRWRLQERIERNTGKDWPQVEAFQANVVDWLLANEERYDWSKVVVYLDPPYLGVTGYEHTISRETIYWLARRLVRLGASVYISEGAPLVELVSEGWEATKFERGGQGTRRWQASKVEEWVTYRRVA